MKRARANDYPREARNEAFNACVVSYNRSGERVNFSYIIYLLSSGPSPANDFPFNAGTGSSFFG